MCTCWKSQTPASISLSRHTKILHTEWVGMGSAALAAAVALRGYGVPNFPQEIDKVLKKQRDIYLLSYEALPTMTTTPWQYLSRALLGHEKITPCFIQFDTPPIFKLYHYDWMDDCIKKEREKIVGKSVLLRHQFFSLKYLTGKGSWTQTKSWAPEHSISLHIFNKK